MRDWAIPAPLDRPPPRKVRMRETALIGFLISMIGVAAPLFAFYALVVAPAYEKRVLETRGIDTSGTVVARQQASNDAKGNYNEPFIAYIYTPKELAGTPDRVVRVERHVSEQDYLAFRLGTAIPLVYDPADPKHAVFKSTVEAGRLGKGAHSTAHALALLTLLAAMFVAILPTYLLWKYFRERRLLRWGMAAEATITGQSEYIYKGLRNAAVTYMFRDGGGAGWTGRKTIPMGRAEDPRPLADLIELPTAVYDPRNGANHMLYPGSMVRLVN